MEKQRKIGLVVALALTTALAVLTTSGPADAAARCGGRGIEVKNTRYVRVYSRVEEFQEKYYYACFVERPRRSLAFHLEEQFSGKEWIGPPVGPAIRGYFMAYGETLCADACTGRVHRLDVRSMRARRIAIGGPTQAVVVRSNGSAAALLATGPTPTLAAGPAGFKVVALGSSGAVDQLDAGAGIDPTSLRLSGSTLTWTNGGQQKSAVLR